MSAANAPTNDRDPAHYWRIASEALEAEKTERLRAMTGSDGLRELERLTGETILTTTGILEAGKPGSAWSIQTVAPGGKAVSSNSNSCSAAVVRPRAARQ